MTITPNKTLILSGWAQPADALAQVVPGALAFDYSDFATAEAAIAALRELQPTQVVAWSLGGQLALRAIGAGALKPKHLTLIGAPLQFVGPEGMGAETYSLFRDSYAKDPARTKTRFHGLVAKGDRDMRRIMELLGHHPEVENTARWLPWLEELAAHKLDIAALASAPPTLIIHGMNDQIVPHAQGEQLARQLPNAQLNSWADVGHAPHLADGDRLKSEIAAHRSKHGVA